MNSPEKRITMKLKHPNPLFEKWLVEWRDDAKEQDSKMQHCFNKAFKSLKKYPLPLERGRDCKILSGFGDRLCQMLDKKLENHNKVSGETLENESESAVKTKRKSSTLSNKDLTNDKRNKKEYIPTYRSGAYAILVALYENSMIPTAIIMHKSEIIEKAKHLCDKSFTKSDPGTFYTAWSSMKTLLDKKLVNKQGNPAKFSLTEDGRILAKNIHEKAVNDLMENKEIEDKINKHIFIRMAQSSREDGVLLNDDICVNVGISNQSSQSQELKNDQEKFLRQSDTILFSPHTFDVLLIVDKQETTGAKEKVQNDPILSELVHMNVPHDVRHLKVGDYTWICRDRATNFELVLPYVIERKRMDDFGSSIKDGRYHEQKFRIKQCGIENIIYLIESYGDNTHTGLPLSTLNQAASNTLIQDRFIVKFSEGLRGTAEYLNCMTNILKKNYESKTVMSCPKANLEKSTINDDLFALMTFKEFNQSGSKYKSFTASEMFIKQLVQLKGLSVDKALAIVERYPTPKLFKMACAEDVAATEKELANVQFGKGKKRIGPVISNTLCKFYSLTQFS